MKSKVSMAIKLFLRFVVQVLFVLLACNVVSISANDEIGREFQIITKTDRLSTDGLGTVAIDGDRALIGVPGHDVSVNNSRRFNVGAVLVLEKNAQGIWQQDSIILADNGFSGDNFGASVAFDNDRLLIGAPGVGSGSFDNGAAYVFDRNASGVWIQSQILVLPESRSTDRFGSSVALEGDRAIVGAPGDQVGSAFTGLVHEFQRNSLGVWELAQTLGGDFQDRQEQFGYSLSLDNTRLLIGARDRSGVGSAYLFEINEEGTWSRQTRLFASDGGSGDQFGFAVSLDGDRAVIGAPHEFPLETAGAAYVFERDTFGFWLETAKLVSFGLTDTSVPDHFGLSVDLQDDRIIVGAPVHDDFTGASFVFKKAENGGWNETLQLIPENVASNTRTGSAVASSGSTVLVDSFHVAQAHLFDVEGPQFQCNGLPVTVNLAAGEVPTSLSDVIMGTPQADIIKALAGDDTICGEGGDDIINGGNGNDWIDGGAGNDQIRGNNGMDEIFGDAGDDEIRGGADDDTIEGEDGDDTLSGQGGNDTIDGGNGVDDISGGGGQDILYAGSGATVGTGKLVFGGSGSDTLIGGPDADDLRGSNGNDIINGFGGNDFISGGLGRDTADGGEGDDEIRGNGAVDTLSGGAGNDLIEGGSQSDVMNGNDGDDTLIGGSGRDELNGGAGSDELFGGADDDTLDGGASAGDLCSGNLGTDTATADCEVINTVP